MLSVDRIKIIIITHDHNHSSTTTTTTTTTTTVLGDTKRLDAALKESFSVIDNYSGRGGSGDGNDNDNDKILQSKIDTHTKGQLDKSEFISIFKNQSLPVSSAATLFDLLDADGDNYIKTNELSMKKK